MVFCFGLFCSLSAGWMILSSSGYSSDNPIMDDHSTWILVFIFLGILIYGRLRRTYNRFVLAHAVAYSPSYQPQYSVKASYVSVNSLKQGTDKAGMMQQPQGRTLSDYLVPGRTQGTEDFQCSDAAAKEDALISTDSRKLCQQAQEVNSVTGNHSSGQQRSATTRAKENRPLNQMASNSEVVQRFSNEWLP